MNEKRTRPLRDTAVTSEPDVTALDLAAKGMMQSVEAEFVPQSLRDAAMQLGQALDKLHKNARPKSE